MACRLKCVVALLGVAALAGGCAETASLTRLPDLGAAPPRVMSKDEQQGKVNDMLEKGQTHETEAAKRIEARK